VGNSFRFTIYKNPAFYHLGMDDIADFNHTPVYQQVLAAVPCSGTILYCTGFTVIFNIHAPVKG
jgi:hypothetical protein